MSSDDFFAPLTHPHDCAKLDYGSNRERIDCANCLRPVYIERHGEGRNDFDVPSENGMLCERCHEVVCIECIGRGQKEDVRICVDCEAVERKEIDDADALIIAAYDAKLGLQNFLAALRKCDNAITIKESIVALNEVEDLFGTINGELVPNIERAYGAQPSLPIENAA